MELHHIREHLRLWQMNQHCARRVMRKHNTEQFGELTFCTGQVKHLKEIQALHLRLFKVPMLNWLVWLYRFRSPQLVSLALNKEGKVVGYECFMAEAEFRGRVWRAWFTYEIPMPYGPWKLGGLPGLILKAEDTDSLFVFEMAGISDFRNGDMHIYRYDERTRKCRREDILKLNDMRGAASGQLNEMHGVKGSVTYMLADPVTGEKKEISYGEMMALVGDVLYIPQMENE